MKRKWNENIVRILQSHVYQSVCLPGLTITYSVYVIMQYESIMRRVFYVLCIILKSLSLGNIRGSAKKHRFFITMKGSQEALRAQKRNEKQRQLNGACDTKHRVQKQSPSSVRRKLETRAQKRRAKAPSARLRISIRR